MDKKVAEGLVAHYRELGGGTIDKAKGQRLMEAYLYMTGRVRDRYGNYLSADGGTRWHFKEQVVRREKRSTKELGGAWYGLSSTPLIQVGLNLMTEAAKALGDEKLLAEIEKRAGARKKGAETRATKARSEENLYQAKVEATKIVAARHPARYMAAVGGVADKALTDELAVLTDEALDRVERGVTFDDGKVASTKKPPVACFVHSKLSYFWIEEVDGVRYSIYLTPRRMGLCDAHIGAPSKGGLSPLVSGSGMRMEMGTRALKVVGDGYISGAIAHRSGDVFSANLLLISSHERRRGVGTRLLKLWCQLMGGYGVREWVALGVGDEGRAAIEAWARGGKISILQESGSQMLIECKSRGRSIFEREEAVDERQQRLPGMVRGRERRITGSTWG